MTCPACKKMRYALEWAEILLKSKGCDYSAYLCKEALAIPCSCGTEEKFKPSHEWASKFYEEKGGDASCDREITQSLTRVSSSGADQSNPESCADNSDILTSVNVTAKAWDKLDEPPNRWIPYSERAPTEEDGVELAESGWTQPCVLAYEGGKPFVTGWSVREDKITHWCRIVLPPVPEPPVDTDEAAFEKWWKCESQAVCGLGMESDCKEAWQAALAHAREGKK